MGRGLAVATSWLAWRILERIDIHGFEQRSRRIVIHDLSSVVVEELLEAVDCLNSAPNSRQKGIGQRW